MTRHGREPEHLPPFKGCGMPAGRDALGLIPCDRAKWHRGACSSKAQRKAARS